MNSELKTLLIPSLWKHSSDYQATGAKDRISAVVRALNSAVHAAASPDIVWSSALKGTLPQSRTMNLGEVQPRGTELS